MGANAYSCQDALCHIRNVIELFVRFHKSSERADSSEYLLFPAIAKIHYPDDSYYCHFA